MSSFLDKLSSADGASKGVKASGKAKLSHAANQSLKDNNENHFDAVLKSATAAVQGKNKASSAKSKNIDADNTAKTSDKASEKTDENVKTQNGKTTNKATANEPETSTTENSTAETPVENSAKPVDASASNHLPNNSSENETQASVAFDEVLTTQESQPTDKSVSPSCVQSKTNLQESAELLSTPSEQTVQNQAVDVEDKSASNSVDDESTTSAEVDSKQDDSNQSSSTTKPDNALFSIALASSISLGSSIQPATDTSAKNSRDSDSSKEILTLSVNASVENLSKSEPVSGSQNADLTKGNAKQTSNNVSTKFENTISLTATQHSETAANTGLNVNITGNQASATEETSQQGIFSTDTTQTGEDKKSIGLKDLTLLLQQNNAAADIEINVGKNQIGVKVSDADWAAGNNFKQTLAFETANPETTGIKTANLPATTPNDITTPNAAEVAVATGEANVKTIAEAPQSDNTVTEGPLEFNANATLNTPSQADSNSDSTQDNTQEDASSSTSPSTSKLEKRRGRGDEKSAKVSNEQPHKAQENISSDKTLPGKISSENIAGVEKASNSEAPVSQHHVSVEHKSDVSVGQANSATTQNTADISLQEKLSFQSNHADPAAQVADGVSHGLRVNKPEIVVKLNPEFLGNVNVRLSTNAAQEVTARLVVDSPETHDLLQSNIHQFKQNLESQGIRVEYISISVATKTDQNFSQNQQSSSQNHSEQNQHQQQHSQQQNQQQQQQQAQQLYQQFSQNQGRQQPGGFQSSGNPSRNPGIDAGGDFHASGMGETAQKSNANPDGSISVFA